LKTIELERPDGYRRAERKEMARWIILVRGQPEGGAGNNYQLAENNCSMLIKKKAKTDGFG
jgi:hypothetical protein